MKIHVNSKIRKSSFMQLPACTKTLCVPYLTGDNEFASVVPAASSSRYPAYACVEDMYVKIINYNMNKIVILI